MPRKGQKEKIKHFYYTNGKDSIRIPFDATPPDGYARGRLKRKLTDEEKKSFNDKRSRTCEERHGSPTYNNSAKCKQTKLANHGDENYNNREQAKITCLEKYDVDNPFKADAIKEQIKSAKKGKYGYDYEFQNRDILLKAIENSQSVDAKEKRKKTCLDRHGVEYAGCLFGLADARDSSCNLEFKQLLEDNSLFVSDELSREKTVGRYRYDFVVGDNLIEINPTATHNSTWSPYGDNKVKSKDYHKLKSQVAIDNGFRCIHVWDWDDKEKVISLLKPRTRVFARKCTAKIIDDKLIVNNFIEQYHLQGKSRYTICVGLFYGAELVSVMTFGKPRYSNKHEYELIRYCSSHEVVGGAEKLFKFFINTYDPKSIVSYCDLSKFSGSTYLKLGFSLKSISIGKHWYNMKTKQHITDNLLRQRGFDQLFGTDFGKNSSNEELMLSSGFVEIYDAGQATYELILK